MPWGRIDDTYYDHPKLEELVEVHEWPDRVVAAGLNALAWSWCNRFLTDGKVPRATVVKLMGHVIGADQAIGLAEQLVAVGLWEQAAGGYAIHDFLHYNDSREQVLGRRQKEAARKAAYRSGKRPTGSPDGTPSVDEPSVPPSVPSGQGRTPRNMSRAESRRVSRDSSRARIPTRPDPTRPTESVPVAKTPSRANGREPTLSKTELDAWRSFGSEWDAVKAAWLERGFRLPPSGEPDDELGQRGLLYPILDARPTTLPQWIREAKGKTGHDVVGHVIERWHQVRTEAGVDDDASGDPAPTRSEAAESLAEIFGRLPVQR